MAGIPAGQLQIEIMASVAKLQDDMRRIESAVGKSTSTISQQAKAANDNLRNIGRGAGAGVQQFSRDVQQLKAQLDPAWAAAQRFRQQQELVNKAFREGAITAKQQIAALRQNAAAYQAAGGQIARTNGAMQSGFQQAGFQISDFAVQVGGGTSAIRAASQQAPQLIQAIQLMGMGANNTQGKIGKLLGILSGPWGIALTVAASVAGALAVKLMEVEKAADEVEFASYALGDAQSILGGVIDLTTGKIKTQSEALINLARAQAIAGKAKARADLAAAQGELRDVAAGDVNYLRSVRTLYQGGGVARDKNAASNIAGDFLAGRITPDKAIAELDRLAEAGGSAADDVLRALQAVANVGVNQENIKVFDELKSAIEGDSAAMQQFLNISDKANRKRKETMSDAEKAQKKQTEETLRFISALEDEIAKLGLEDKAIRQLEVAKEMAAAQTQAEKDRIAELNDQRERKIELLEREKKAEEAAKENDKIAQTVAALEREAQVLGLIGWEREKILLQLQQGAELSDLAAKIKAAELAGEVELVEELKKRLALLQKIYGIQIQLGDESERQRREEAHLEFVNGQLRDMIGLLGRIGGFGTVIGAAIGLFSGNTSAVGGPIGELLNATVGQRYDEKTGKYIGVTIGDEMREIFKLDGEFGKTMTSILGGAGTGLFAANAFGFTSTGSQIGSAIGGALGKVAGEALGKSVGGMLGSALGPLGSIAGGLLGGALGSLLSSTPRGSVNIGDIGGELGITGSRGNSSGRIAASTKTANAIIDSLESLAAQLGATIDPSRGSVSIGIRKGNYRVDTSGSGKTKTKKGAIDFGTDAEAAAYFAMLDLIKDGVLQGLRAGTERLLKNADNLEAGLAKALQFENVFKELKERTDPLGFAMEEIGREAAQLSALFKEAGATAEEYAQLEELLAMKREEAIDRARQEALDNLRDQRELEIRILELLGRSQDALAAARELELEGLKDSLKPLQSMIYTLEDARLILDQFEPLAADLRAFKKELLGSETRNSFAAIAARFSETAALAKGGDADALAQLRGVSSEFLDAARANASSRLDYDRAVGQVLAAVDDGIFAADSQI